MWSLEAGCSYPNSPPPPPGQAQIEALIVFLRHAFHEPARAKSTLITAIWGSLVKWETRLTSTKVDSVYPVSVPL